MIAAGILGSAFRSIFADPGQTMRIFALPALLMAGIAAAAIWAIMQSPRLHAGVIFIPAAMAAILCGFWPVINFHRHILLGERFGWLPRLYWREVIGYGVMTIPLGLVVLGANILATLAAREVMSADPILIPIPPMAEVLLITLLLGTFTTAVALRLFSLLPGLAIGAPMAGYARTARGSLIAIGLVALAINLVLIGYALLQIALIPHLFAAFGDNFGMAIFAIRLPLSTLSSVFGISLLTTLYARYVGAPA